MHIAIKTDYLIVGTGIAGLTLAIKLAEQFPKRMIHIITKDEVSESNTKYAQGGIAVVLDSDDSFENHIKDTLIAGDGLCNPKVVERVIKEGPQYFKALINWGSQFDQTHKNGFDLGKEGGHSHHRVVHHKDITGAEIERALINKVLSLQNITILDHHFAIDLIVMDNTCYGIHVLNTITNCKEYILAQSTTLATGGIGQLYGHTTNPVVATGDGIAMAHRAYAKVSHMEFIQFHPTVLYSEHQEKSFLISEAVRGFGAYLRDKTGERFMFRFDDRGELASRDIVSRGIHHTLQTSNDLCVYLDCTHLDITAFKTHFPTIYQHCLDEGIDVEQDWIPVVPASHYVCGGIDVDSHGQTSISNLFACGECSNTGLHGANRLASNSLLEALVYSHHIFDYHLNFPTKNVELYHITPKEINSLADVNPMHIDFLKSELQNIMMGYVGIVRQNNALHSAKEQLLMLKEQVNKLAKSSALNKALLELRNMVDTALLIVIQSINRSENKGGFYNQDLCLTSYNTDYAISEEFIV